MRCSDGKHLGEHVAALEEGLVQRRLVGGERPQPSLRLVDLAFESLHPLARIDEMLVQRSAVLVEGVDLLAELRLALLGQRHVAGDRVELGLPLGPRCRGGRLVRRRVPGGRGRNRHRAGKGGSGQQSASPASGRLRQIAFPRRFGSMARRTA